MSILNRNKMHADTLVEWTVHGRKEAEQDSGSGIKFRILQALEDNDGSMTIGALAAVIGRTTEDTIAIVEQMMPTYIKRGA